MKRQVLLLVLIAGAGLALVATRARVTAVEVDPMLEQAMFKRERFFGADAIVPLPSGEAFTNLERLRPDLGDDPKYLEKFAGVAERVGRYDIAEDALKRLAAAHAEKTLLIAEYYARRGLFEKQAEVWAAALEAGNDAERPMALENLLTVARRHAIGRYLSKDFVTRVAQNNVGNKEVLGRLIENESDPERALELIRGARAVFRDDGNSLLRKEIETLQDLGRGAEAEKVFAAAFDPFWDDETSRAFYDLLDERDRLRAYGRELREAFRKDPSGFDAAVRYAHYCGYDYNVRGEVFDSILKRLEAAKKTWTTDELVTVTRMLIRRNNASEASRYLYTLTLRRDFVKGSPQRGRVLYQLFEMFADAGTSIPTAKGDLRFYADVAGADTDPGILTGILSLLFADTKPGNRLGELETKLAGEFNHAAAYRVFLAFREEDPASPLIAQMYLDLIRLYAAKRETAVAASLLAEFASNYQRSSDYPLAAIKLADAYAAMGDGTNERAALQTVLDHFGSRRLPLTPTGTPSDRNSGIDIPKDGSDANKINDLLGRDEEPATYAEALDRMVASYSRERKTAEILGLYSAEIAKYPDEEWLYLRRLTWLETAGLTEDQLELYRTALAKFQSRSWQDKLARFLLRQKRSDEFKRLATDLAGKLDEREAADFLAFANGNDIGTDLALALNRRAHERFPHNTAITETLMRLNRQVKNESEWRRLAAENFFESASIRGELLEDLAKRGELRDALVATASENTAIAELFRAEASSRLSDFEGAAGSFARLDELYPETREFNDRLIELERSFGQRDRTRLERAATLAKKRADASLDNAGFRTVAGEILAESGQYGDSDSEWQRMVETAKGDREIYLETAGVQWDYYQFADALKTIERGRTAFKDPNMFAFEAGSIRETLGDRAGALREFVAALGDPYRNYQSRRHLVNLAKNGRGATEIDAAFGDAVKRFPDDARLTIAYGELLGEVGRATDGDRLIIEGAGRTEDPGLLDESLSYLRENGRGDGARAVMRRISETTSSTRRRIEKRIQIAESFAGEERKTEARDEALAIVRDNPNNFGAIVQTTDFLRRAGFPDDAAAVVREALAKSKVRFRPALAKKLAETLTASGRPDLAAAEIARVHSEDPGNTGVFEALVLTAIRTKDIEGLRAAFGETVKALRAKSTNKPLLDSRIAELRRRMIDAFTRLGDFDSAIDQYIELINRDPADEDLTESAIRYTERRGGGPRLVAYYEKLAAESFKNYRWNVVLARLRDASGDPGGAIAEYDKAIVNRPEMHELQLAAAEIEIIRKNYDAALKRVDKALELTNDDPALLRRKIAVLKLAGRTAEIEAVRAKLPAETDPAKDKDKFDAARRTALEDRSKAREIFRKAFDELRDNPLSGEPKAADIRAYADAMRGEVSLGEINRQLWELRDKLRSLAAVSDTNRATEARRRQSIIETAIVETVGSIASTTATDVELAAIHEDLRGRPDGNVTGEDRAKTSALVRDLSRRCGFGDIEESMLVSDAGADPKANLSRLLDFYNKRGAYRKASDAAQKYGASPKTRAAAAKLVGDRDLELVALREIFDQPAEDPESFERYFSILLESDPEKLRSLATAASKHPFAVINFFVRRGMADDAHRAIDSAPFDKAWKAARHAQIVYALKEKGGRAMGYFDDALRLMPIGQLIKSKTDAEESPTGEDWFRIALDFGRWRLGGSDPAGKSYLAAMTEGLPESAGEQYRLGRFLYEKGDLSAALEHFRLAIDLENAPVARTEYVAAVGAAHWKLGNRAEAMSLWSGIIARKSLGADAELVVALAGFGLAAEAQKLVAPVLANQPEYDEEMGVLVASVADSFDDEDSRARYFIEICRSGKLAADIAEEIAGRLTGPRREPFLAIVIRGDRGPGIRDSVYEDAYRRAFRDRSVAEAILDHESGYEFEEPVSRELSMARELLVSLIARGAFAEAGPLLSDIESSLDGRYPRPVWLRVMRIRIDARGGDDVLSAAERFVGIDVPDTVESIRPPDLERFNLVKEFVPRLAASYFARRLALGDYDASNFIGLATELKKNGENDAAKRLIELMTEIAGDSRETAAREIAGLELVKAKLPDPTRYESDKDLPSDLAARRRLAAVAGDDLGDAKSAGLFRRLLAESADATAADRIAFAKSIVGTDKPTAMRLLLAVSDSFETPRPERWRARVELWRGGVPDSLPDIAFDAYSQFYQGILAKEGRLSRLVASMLISPDAVPDARPELVKAYGRDSIPFAALDLAKSLSDTKSDDVLDVLSYAAESVGDLGRAIEFERSRSDKGRAERIESLRKKLEARPKPATELVIDAGRTNEQ